MRYVKRYRLIETKPSGSQSTQDFDDDIDAENEKQVREWWQTDSLSFHQQSDFKIEEVYVLEEDQ